MCPQHLCCRRCTPAASGFSKIPLSTLFPPASPLTLPQGRPGWEVSLHSLSVVLSFPGNALSNFWLDSPWHLAQDYIALASPSHNQAWVSTSASIGWVLPTSKAASFSRQPCPQRNASGTTMRAGKGQPTGTEDPICSYSKFVLHGSTSLVFCWPLLSLGALTWLLMTIFWVSRDGIWLLPTLLPRTLMKTCWNIMWNSGYGYLSMHQMWQMWTEGVYMWTGSIPVGFYC